MAYVALEKLHNLQDGYRKLVRIDNREYLLLHEAGKSWLIENRCPHMGSPLAQGQVQAGTIRCPMHGLVFNLTTGFCQSRSCEGRLQARPLIYEGNTIGVEV